MNVNQVIFFPGLKERLDELGFEPTKLPWRMHSISYDIVQVSEDELGYVYSIESNSYHDNVFRGRIPSVEILNLVLLLVMEGYLLTDPEIEKLKTLS